LTTDELIVALGNKFAALVKYNNKSGTIYYQSESIFLDGGQHFCFWGDTPKEAMQKLYNALKKLE